MKPFAKLLDDACEQWVTTEINVFLLNTAADKPEEFAESLKAFANGLAHVRTCRAMLSELFAHEQPLKEVI